jgi:transposase-like protein
VNTSPHTSLRRAGGYQPPFCPNPNCRFHKRHPDWRFVRNGYRIRRSDNRRFQDFRCTHCRRRFTSATFSTLYWLRRRDLLLPIAQMICEGAGLRQIARVLGTTHSTVARHVARLGRHCLLFHRNLLENHELDEPLVIDGFESFEYSQYFPFHINLAVGGQSWFTYHFNDSPLRRKGRMTAAQRRRRTELEELYGRPDPKAVELAIAALLEPLLTGSELVLHSDDHPAYRRALHRLSRSGRTMPRIEHRITSSKQRRSCSNPLFPVNLVDLLLRHGSANHHRETIAFSKRRQAAMERKAISAVWRNYVKKRRENGPPVSAAMWLGLVDRLLSWREILRRRLFPGHTELPEPWGDYYWRRVKTVVYGNQQATHRCRYAF